MEVKNKEANYESQIASLKCHKQCIRDVFRDGKESSKVWVIQLKILNNSEGAVGFSGSKPKKRWHG